MTAVTRISAAATSYGICTAMRWCSGSTNACRKCESARRAAIRNPTRITTATVTGAIISDRFSQSSRRTDQYSGRVVVTFAVATAGMPAAVSRTASDCVFIPCSSSLSPAVNVPPHFLPHSRQLLRIVVAHHRDKQIRDARRPHFTKRRQLLPVHAVIQQDASPENLPLLDRLQRACRRRLLRLHHHFGIAQLELFHAATQRNAPVVDEHQVGQ